MLHLTVEILLAGFYVKHPLRYIVVFFSTKLCNPMLRTVGESRLGLKSIPSYNTTGTFDIKHNLVK